MTLQGTLDCAGETKCPGYTFESGQVKLGKIQQKGNKEAFSSTLNSRFDIWMQQIILDNIEVSLKCV